MFHIFGFVLLILLLILVIGVGLIASFARSLFGLAKGNKSSKQGTSTSTNYSPTEEGEIHLNHKKIFAKDEGEYVDFEEVNTTK